MAPLCQRRAGQTGSFNTRVVHHGLPDDPDVEMHQRTLPPSPLCTGQPRSGRSHSQLWWSFAVAGDCLTLLATADGAQIDGHLPGFSLRRYAISGRCMSPSPGWTSAKHLYFSVLYRQCETLTHMPFMLSNAPSTRKPSNHSHLLEQYQQRRSLLLRGGTVAPTYGSIALRASTRRIPLAVSA